MKARIAVLFVASLFASSVAHADLTLVLSNAFISKYKDRATMESERFVDIAHKKPNPPKSDGDLHIAVRCDEAKLSGVAEIQNAASVSDVVDRVHQAEGSGNKVKITGAWRLWPEHGGTNEVHDQRKPPTEAFTTTNPDHLFEIHSIVDFDGSNQRPTWHPIEGFTPKDANDALMHYESKKFKISTAGNYVKMQFPGVGYNYVKFQAKLLEAPHHQVDGETVFASLNDLDGEMLIRERRLVFVGGNFLCWCNVNGQMVCAARTDGLRN